MNVAELIIELEKIADQSQGVWFYDEANRVSVERLVETEDGIELDCNP
jgi:hypothetical protein